jgi:segregation and condensation protein B
LLFVHPHPLTVKHLRSVLDDAVEVKDIKDAVEKLVAEYRAMGRAFHLEQIAGGYQFRTRADYAPWVQRLQKVKPVKLSQPAMETLAVVAYRQPIVRAEIEAVRGVDSGWVLNTLLEKGLLRILGRKEVPGRPLVYGTTRKFLQLFGLRDLGALPTLRELDSMAQEES